MLVDINLLPKRESKNYMMIATLLAAVSILLVAGIFLLWQGKSLENGLATLDNQIRTTEKLIELEQEKALGGVGVDAVEELEVAVRWASEDPLKTVPIIEHVTALLPNRGFIQSISYAESGNVNVTVQFDTSRESAYYLKSLLDSDWIANVNLSTVSTREMSSSDEAEQNEDVIPRYIGQYQLQLDRSFIQMEDKAVAESGGGVET